MLSKFNTFHFEEHQLIINKYCLSFQEHLLNSCLSFIVFIFYVHLKIAQGILCIKKRPINYIKWKHNEIRFSKCNFTKNVQIHKNLFSAGKQRRIFHFGISHVSLLKKALRIRRLFDKSIRVYDTNVSNCVGCIPVETDMEFQNQILHQYSILKLFSYKISQ